MVFEGKEELKQGFLKVAFKKKKKKNLLLFYVCAGFACILVHAPGECSAHGGQKKVLGPLELEL